MLFIVVVLSCVMMKIVCSALSHEVLNSQHYKHSQSTEACADDAKKWAGLQQLVCCYQTNKLSLYIMFYFQSSVFKQFTDNDILINYKMYCFVLFCSLFGWIM